MAKRDEEDMHIVLALPTPHNVWSPVKKQFGEVTIDTLTDTSTVDLSISGLKSLTFDFRNSIRAMFDKYGKFTEVYLILTGLPIVNHIAYMMFDDKTVCVNFLMYDSAKRRYFKLTADEINSLINLKGWGES